MLLTDGQVWLESKHMGVSQKSSKSSVANGIAVSHLLRTECSKLQKVVGVGRNGRNRN